MVICSSNEPKVLYLQILAHLYTRTTDELFRRADMYQPNSRCKAPMAANVHYLSQSIAETLRLFFYTNGAFMHVHVCCLCRRPL